MHAKTHKKSLLGISMIFHTGVSLRDCLGRMSRKVRLNSAVSCQWLRWAVNITPSSETQLFSYNTQSNRTLFSLIPAEKLFSYS